MEEMFIVRSLVKEFLPSFRLGPLDIDLKSGETTAIIGQNGSGKSTFFQMITGNMDATSGEVFLQGKKLTPESFHLKRALGYLPQHSPLPQWISGKDLLSYATRIQQIAPEKLERDIDYWECRDFIKKPLAACSHGMKKRISLCLSMLHDPRFLVLDEPFGGLDLVQMNSLERAIAKRHQDGHLTIIGTHLAHFAAKLCSSAFYIKNGSMYKIERWGELDLLGRISALERAILNVK